VTETEALLNAHDDISQAVVIARRDSRQGSTRITAYLVYEPGESLTASVLRRHLRGRVDDDRVPQHFVELDELPAKPTGEIDRAALPDPFGEADDHVAPRTPMEQAIAEVWRELLGTDRVSVHDNFLDVGGHSLLAMRAISRIAKKTGVRVSPSALNLQTLEQIAAECEAGAAPPAAEAPQPAAEPAGGLRQRLMSAVRQTVARV
ncbi:MAG: hypothetical protein ICV87_09825, partial [Gemmatimonadetes bacterium]|nr:hypothetical protein [Gemmatimonadota bacterium]